MSTEEMYDKLLVFFKALSDGNRLKIIGLLATEARTVEQIASLLGIGVSTASHHLARLAEAGLVTARTEGHYYYYSLKTEVLREMTEKLLKTENLLLLTKDVEMDAYDKKVLNTFLDQNGMIKAFPSQEKKFLVLLQHVRKAFSVGVRYTEKEMNEILARFNADTAYLRRGLIEYRIMDRETNGSAYWLVE